MEQHDLGSPERYDLHAHSVFSDGSETAAALVAEARAHGLAGIAVTDHDSLEQLSAVRETARDLGFPVLAGIEISAEDPATGRKVHVLGFGLEATADGSGPVERMVAETCRRRCANTLWQAWRIERLVGEAGFLDGCPWAEVVDGSFSVDAAVARAEASSAVYKQHVMEALCHLPYTNGAYQQVYRALFKGDGPVCHDIAYPAAVDAVRAVREQGGHAVLAHPGQVGVFDLIDELVAAGLEGIEVHHPDHGDADVERAHAAAAAHGLFCTGGSDYHGRYGAPPHMGCCTVGADEAGERVRALFAAEARLG